MEGKGTQVIFHLNNLPQYLDQPSTTLAVHIHEYADFRKGCDGAGSHFNPENVKHGSFALHGLNHHAGDMINNIKVSPDRSFYFSYIDPLFTVSPGPWSIVGRSVVIHSGTDDEGRYRDFDQESAKTGNAGSRIACAVIGYAKP